MEHGRIVQIVVILSLFGLFFGYSTQTQSKDDEGELRKIEGETARLEQQDDKSIAKFLADDWVCACAKGLSKEEVIENVKHGFKVHGKGVNLSTIEKKDMKVYVFGDTAVVTFVKEYRQKPDMKKFFDEDDTDVFTRDASGWHLHFTKISPVQQAESN